MSNPRPAQRLSDYTSVAFETMLAVFSILPILLLIHFYPILPEQVPVFLNLRGEVEVWAAKSVVSVFRVPAMALDLQAICLLMKYGVVQSKSRLPAGNVEAYSKYQRRASALGAYLWDWLRCFAAIKMSAESLDVLFMSDEQWHFLRTLGRAVAWTATILGVVGALLYAYRLLLAKRKMQETIGKAGVEQPVDKSLFNFANKWVYALAACIIAYPLLVFLPLMLGR